MYVRVGAKNLTRHASRHAQIHSNNKQRHQSKALKSMGQICPSVSTTTPQQFTTQSQKEVACVFVSHWSSPPSHATTLFHQLKLSWHPLFHGEEKRHCFHMILPIPCRKTCRRRLSGTTHHTPSCPWSAVIKWKRKKGVRTSFPFSVGDQKRFGIHRQVPPSVRPQPLTYSDSSAHKYPA